MKKIILILILAASQFSFAQSKGTVKGLLTDKEMNNEALPFANVFIKDTTIGTTSDIDGLYSLSIPEGNYTIIFSFIGYKTIEKPLTIKAGETTTINQVMSAEEGVALEEVEVKAVTTREKASALLLDQKKAVVIKESIGAEELATKGISDAAGAVAKISGVSKQEGSSNVYVRGLGDRYLNTTMNGLSLPSNDINKKNINLNLFPSDIIQNVSISKAYSSNFYGDFAAGNVDITSKEYKGNGFLTANVSSGINTRAAGENFKKSEGTGYFGYYNRFKHNPFAVVLSHGIDPVDAGEPINTSIGINAGKSFDFENESRLSFFGTVSFERGFKYREGPLVNYTNVAKKEFPNAKEYEYSTATTAMASAIYRINSDHKLKYTSLFLNNSSDEVGYYGTEGLGKNRDAQLDTDKGFYQMNVQYNQDLIFVNQLVGEHTIEEEKLKLTWGIGYNNVFAHEPDRKRISLENYHLALDNDPNTNPSFYNNIVFDNQRYFQKIIDEELNSRINLEYKASDKLTWNFGYNGRIKTRDFTNIRYGYDFINSNQEVTDVNNFNSIFNIENFGNLYNTEVFNGINPPTFGSTNLPGLDENTYSGELRVYAGYVSAAITPNEKWTIVPGVRLESFNQDISYDVININPNDAKFREANETFILPSLNTKYALTDNQNLRFTFSKTVSVPEFKEVTPFLYEGIGESVGGNPDLLNDPSFSEVYNLDIKYEWFITRDELLSFSAFTKQIHNPINLVVANDASGNQRYFRSGDKAEVYGVELEARKNLILNEDEQTQLSAGFNFTYMHTKQDLKDVAGLYSVSFNRASDELQGASPILVNANINYSPTNFENYKPIASLVFSYFSDRIDALGSGQLGNIIEKGIPVLDFVWKNKIGEDWELNFSAKNLLDPSIKRIRENTSIGDVTLSEYKLGMNLGLGLTYKF
ncbi:MULTISPECIES: TonB-dependent receptor [Tenacibaculum]|uniref:TonB-dependent receptor n=1 Tax=Tenacibaculum TaxID=104267 RepID=UPI001F0A430B|nr:MULTISPECIES: TonB-dependent receptor [Tenacibaculum]MCH3881062.1 TonB-dependent receptor [Tenacibaculum aquimarinum]MDO6599338.1 TonB-dependent receptor [Tenacibaculum sp. 1_MG-2023]